MRAALLQAGIHFEERDFFTDRLSEGELRHLMGSHSPSEIFSWKSPSFKKLRLAPDSLSGDQLVELMLAEPKMIRRPLIVMNDKLIIGSDIKAVERAFCNE